MKYKNITAFLLGLLVAGLLWEYYLKPRYLINNGDEETLSAIQQADIAALNEATAQIEGEVLFKDYGGEVKNDLINNSSGGGEAFAFHSTANHEPDFFEQAAHRPEKETKVFLENDSLVMHPSAINAAQTEGAIDSSSLPNRITMIGAPVKFTAVSSAKDYKAYKANAGRDLPEVDFSKNRIVFVESAGELSDGFFEIKDFSDGDDAITINYRVNIIGAANRPDFAPYVLIPAGDKKIVLNQVK